MAAAVLTADPVHVAAAPPVSRVRGVFGEVAYYVALAVLTTVLAIRAIGLTVQSWTIPLVYYGDALSGGSQFKNTMANGWYEYNPDLGAPWGLHFHDFPTADNLHLMVARVLGLFTDQWALAFNIYYLITFPLAAITGAWFIRLVGGSPITAFGLGMLFAFAPYHFIRNEGHLYLAAYYPVPLAAGLIYLLLAGRPIWARRATGRAWNPWSWATMRTVATVLILAMMGTASTYYSFFSLLFLAFVAFTLVVLQRSLRVAIPAVVAGTVLVAVMLANMLPDMLFEIGRPANLIGLTRNSTDTEIYAFKFSSLVLPVPWERIGALATKRAEYDSTFPLPSELPVLGLVATGGFLLLMAVAALGMLRGLPVQRRGEESSFWIAQRRLSYLTLFGFLVGTVGGLSTLFTIFVSDSIRGWNRIAIFLSLFTLAAVGLVVDGSLSWVARRVAIVRERRFAQATLASVVVAVIVAGGLYDQVPPVQAAQLATYTAQWNSDQDYVDAIEADVPAGTMVFQLPYLPFPESGRLVDMFDSDDLRPYLHSHDLRWSYGGIKGRPQSDWADLISSMPTENMLVAVGAATFGGVNVDRAGYTAAAGQALEADLRRILGVAPIVSTDGRFAFFSMQTYNAGLAARYPSLQLGEIGSHAVSHPVIYWQQDYQPPGPDANGAPTLTSKVLPSPKLFVDSARDGPTRVTLSFTLSASGATGPVRVQWPDGVVETVDLGAAAIPMSRQMDLPNGRSTLVLSMPHSPAPGVTFVLADYRLVDPVLQFTVAP